MEDLVIALPKMDGPQVVVEKADDGQMYFAIQDHPARPQPDSADSLSVPKHVVIFWDASGLAGRRPRAGNRLAAGIFPTMVGIARIVRRPARTMDLVLFRNAARQAAAHRDIAGGPAALAAALQNGPV